MSSSERRRREHDVFELPDTVDLAAVNEAEIAVIRLATRGVLDAREALRFSRMLEHRRKAIGDASLEEEMMRLEAAIKRREGKP